MLQISMAYDCNNSKNKVWVTQGRGKKKSAALWCYIAQETTETDYPQNTVFQLSLRCKWQLKLQPERRSLSSKGGAKTGKKKPRKLTQV